MWQDVFRAPGTETKTIKKKNGTETTTIHGKLSGMRVLFMVYGGGVLVVWGIVCVTSKDIKDIPTNVAVILGALFGSKALQSLGESK